MNKFPVSLSGNQLKCLAMAIMLIDHLAYIIIERGILLGNYTGGQLLSTEVWNQWYAIDRVMRAIGRMAFPIFCFMIVEGFGRTHDAKKYLIRLFLFALASEIPFDLAFRGTPFFWGYQNVFWTLGFGLLAMMIFESRTLSIPVKLLGMGAACLIPYVIHTDYSCYGVLVILFLHVFREEKLLSCVMAFVVLVVMQTNEVWAGIGFALLFLYNGERGHGNKYLFYAFYSGHLLILVFLAPMICPRLAQLF